MSTMHTPPPGQRRASPSGPKSGQDRPGTLPGEGGAAGRASRGLTHSTLSGLFWMFFATAAQAVLQLVVVAVLARLLAPADFGVVSAALVVVGFSTIFSQLGVGPAIVQRPVLEERHIRTGFTLSVMFGAAMTAVVSLLAPATSAFFRMQDLAPVVAVLAIVFTMQGLSMVGESLLQRDLEFRGLALIEVSSFAVGFGGVGVVLALAGLGVWALVAAQIAQTALKTIIVVLVKPHRKLPQLEFAAMRDLLYFGGGFTAARVGNYVAGQVDNLVVGRGLGPAALGIYGRAYQLMTAPANFFGQVLDKVLFPAMVKIQDRTERLSLAYRRGVSLIALVILPVSAVCFALAPELIHVMLGPQWKDVILPFRILTVGMILRTSYKMSDSMARATGSVYRRAWRQLIYAGMVAAGAWAGMAWGLPGVAAGVLVAITINFFLMAQLSMSLSGVTWGVILGAHGPALVLTTILGAEAWLLETALRVYKLRPLEFLAVTGFLLLCTALLLLRLAPRLTLGEDGIWMMQTLSSYVPQRMSPVRLLNLERLAPRKHVAVPGAPAPFAAPPGRHRPEPAPTPSSALKAGGRP